MAVKARASITLATIRDVKSTAVYYKLQSSTATKPAKPTANPPSGWTTTEPGYTAGSTNSLYATQLTVFTDGTFAYSDVSLSSSYEAAKAAYNKAVAAGNAAGAAQAAVDGMEIGGRNLVLGTSADWVSYQVRDIINCIPWNLSVVDMNGRGLKAGDTIQISFDVRFSEDFTGTSTGTNNMFFQGTCNDGGTYTNIAITGGTQSNKLKEILDSKSRTGHINTYIKITSAMVNGTYSGRWRLNIRFDYYSGLVYIRNVKAELGTIPTDWTPAPEDVAADIATAQSTANNALTLATQGLGLKPNYSDFKTANPGEAYLHGYTDSVAADVDGWVIWNGIKRTVPKKMLNPNTILPYNTYIYIVLRLSSSTATSGALYMVWYDGGWKYAATPTPTAIGGTWTWAETTDIVLGQFVEPGNEQAFVDAYLYNPPRNASQTQSSSANAYAKAASAQSTANTARGAADTARIEASNAAKTATNYLHYDSTNGLVIAQSAPADAAGVEQLTGGNVRLTTQGMDVYHGSNRVARYGDMAVIGSEDKMHVEIDASSMKLRDEYGHSLFQVSVSDGEGAPVVGDPSTNPDFVAGGVSFVAGTANEALGYGSTAIGHGLVAASAYQTVVGRYNATSSTDIFQVGNGTRRWHNTAFAIDEAGGMVLDVPYITINSITVGENESVTIAPNSIAQTVINMGSPDYPLADIFQGTVEYDLLGIIAINNAHSSALILTNYHVSGNKGYITLWNRSSTNSYTTKGMQVTGLFRYKGCSSYMGD